MVFTYAQQPTEMQHSFALTQFLKSKKRSPEIKISEKLRLFLTEIHQ